jgi:hypothetical protein
MVCWVIVSNLVLDAVGCVGRQEYSESGAAAGALADLDASAVRQHDGPADGQPEPMAGYPLVRRRWRADERLEDALTIFDRDARPLVLNREGQIALGSRLRRDANGGGWWRVLERVLDQIGEHPLHGGGIQTHGGQCGRHVEP